MPKHLRQDVSPVKDSDYRALAEFRHQIYRYLNFSDEAANAAGLEPKQYQLMLSIKGLPEGLPSTIGVLAERLHIHHNSAVELVNRAEAKHLVKRKRAERNVCVHLTKQGEGVLEHAVQERLIQLRIAGPILVDALQRLNNNR